MQGIDDRHREHAAIDPRLVALVSRVKRAQVSGNDQKAGNFMAETAIPILMLQSKINLTSV
ncbi:hypothetical protein A7X89_18605 [Stenotrophomonas maltophilia]|nr:hypothetical protein A7X89_18605 [Stenotrophomonas maltophilia]